MAYRTPLVVTIFLQLMVSYKGHLPPSPDIPSIHYSSNGTADFTLGALLPVHTYLCLGGACQQTFNGFSLLQRMEAITYAVEEINARNDLLRGFTLGYVIYDDQDTPSTALAQGLRFVQWHQYNNSIMEGGGTMEEDDHCNSDGTMPPCRTMKKHSVVGVIASESSLSTLQVATLFSPFKLPQISYLSTSSSLSSRQKYPFFFRTVPSGESQAQAIIGLMRHYNWRYASVVFSAGQYGTSGYRDLLKSIDEVRREDSGYRMCFGIAREIDDSWTVRQYKDLIYELLLERYATTVVAYISLSHARILFALAEGMAIERKLTWIATDAWLNELDDLTESAKAKVVGALSVKAKSVNPPRFYRRFRQLTPASSRNPWLPRFLEVHFNCSYPAGANPALSTCKPDLNISRDGRNPRERTVSLVYDAVYAFAHALQAALDLPSCKLLQGKEPRKNCAIRQLPQTLRSVRFQGETGEVTFDGKTLSVSRAYSLYNLQDRSGQWSLVDVGTYDRGAGGLSIESDQIQWSNGTMPSTKCNKRCEVGYGQRVTEQCCCWMCEKCPKHHIVVFLTAEGRWECQACIKGMWPDPTTRRTCDVIKPTFVRWNDPLGIIISSLASTGLAACMVTFILYVMNNSHPLVKASSRELSYFLLASIGICYSFCFFFLLRPSSALCVVRQFGISVCFTLLYGPLVTKTSRIYRIFEASSQNRRACCVASKSQLGIAILLVLIQCSIIIGFLVAKPPVVELKAEEGVNRVDETCSSDERAYITSFTFNGLLLVASMYCAFKTRKLPDHFNEARFMTFCVYSTLIIWLTFIPVYFIVRTALHQILLLSLGVLVNATLVLICFFAPKLVAVYLVDQVGDDAPGKRFKTGRKHKRSFHRSWSKSSGVHPITPPEIVEQTTLTAIGETSRENSVSTAQCAAPVMLVSVAGTSASSASDQSELATVVTSEWDKDQTKVDESKDNPSNVVLKDSTLDGMPIIASQEATKTISKSGSGFFDTSLREDIVYEKPKSA